MPAQWQEQLCSLVPGLWAAKPVAVPTHNTGERNLAKPHGRWPWVSCVLRLMCEDDEARTFTTCVYSQFDRKFSFVEWEDRLAP